MLKHLLQSVGAAEGGDPVVRFKINILEKTMPAETAVIFGDMWKVEGYYTQKTLELGCKRAVLIDSLETEEWLRKRLKRSHLDFFKGDFSNTQFMKSIIETFDIGVAFDILLHQPPLLNTLHLMLEKVEKRFCVVQPMLREQNYPNCLVYLPGSTNELYPIGSKHDEYRMFDELQVNQSHWIWGMTATFLNAVLRGEGFEIVHQQELASMPNVQWYWGGFVYEKRSKNPTHWSTSKVTPGLYKGSW